MMAEIRKNTLNDLDVMFEKTRTISDFIEKHCFQKVKIIFGKGLTEEQFEAVPDDVVIIGSIDGPKDSIEAVHYVGVPLHLNYYGDPIEGIVLGDGTVWFDSDDFRYRRDPYTFLLKDVEEARRKLEENGGSDYVQTFGDGKILFSFDGLKKLTEVYEAEDRLLAWLNSVIRFCRSWKVWRSDYSEEMTFSIS